MRTHEMSKLMSCWIMVLVTSTVFTASVEAQTNKQEIYWLNQTKTYKVIFPKRGYIGAPPSPSPLPDFRLPTRDEHFKTCFVRVTILAPRIHNKNQRIVLKTDEVDQQMKLLHEGLYYSYIDILPLGVKVISQHKDDDGDHTETGLRYSIPCPFDCARPPKLGFKSGSCDGHRDEIGYGVKYFKKDKKDDSPVVNIEAVRFRNLEGVADSNGIKSVADRPAKWYTSEVDDVVKSKETKILYRENQKWASESDWLWDEMERFDKDGNILMKCKKIQ